MRVRLVLFAAAAVAHAAPVRAGSLELAPKETVPPSITQSEPWQFTIAVPGLMPSIDGMIGVRGVNADIDIGFDQILEHLDMLFAMRAEARKGPFGMYAEFFYVGLSDGPKVLYANHRTCGKIAQLIEQQQGQLNLHENT
jgi:hypothetical protein